MLPYKIIFTIFALALTTQIHAQQCRIVNKAEKGYILIIDNVTHFAYTREEIQALLKTNLELSKMINSLENIKDQQQGLIDSQRAQISLMHEQLADYGRLNDKFESLLRLKPRFYYTAGVGYANTDTEGNEVMGMVGLGFGDWRIMGIFQPSSVGTLISRDF